MQGVKGRLAWRVLPNYTYYIVQLSTAKDVSELCDLENEFIEDHRVMLADHGMSNEDLHSEIGVDPDPLIRTQIVQSIASRKLLKGRQDFTLKCAMYPSQYFVRESTVAPQPEVVGYVYLKVKSGSSSSSSAGTVQTGKQDDSVETSGKKLVISHLKVSQQHQGNSCAKLLLAGMLRFVSDRQEGGIRGLQLSAVEPNKRAIALYRKLGFEKSSEYTTKCKWFTMVKKVEGLDLHDISEEWMHVIQTQPVPHLNPSSPQSRLSKGIMEGSRKSDKRSVESSEVEGETKRCKLQE
jgi:ribosomal protein S18 acetylase RimI-like enzyme